MGEASEDFKDFLKSINGQFTSSEFSDKLKRELDRVKRNKECRREYMTLYLHEEEIKRKSYVAGLEEGIKEGIKEGKSLLVKQAVSFYLKGKITEREAAEELNITVEEFCQVVDEYKASIEI